jgi:P-type Cu+ transporter
MPQSEKLAVAGSAIDPVCRISVDITTAKHISEHGQIRYFFCSAGC